MRADRAAAGPGTSRIAEHHRIVAGEAGRASAGRVEGTRMIVDLAGKENATERARRTDAGVAGIDRGRDLEEDIALEAGIDPVREAGIAVPEEGIVAGLEEGTGHDWDYSYQGRRRCSHNRHHYRHHYRHHCRRRRRRSIRGWTYSGLCVRWQRSDDVHFVRK